MKRNILLNIFLILLLVGTVAQEAGVIEDSCNATEAREKCKNALKPFKYDAGKIVRITFKSKPQMKEFEIPLYMGEKYRFIFNTEGLSQGVDINVYNKKIGSNKRELLYTTKDKTPEDNQYIWEPEKSRKMYINFDIPATTDTIKKGCAVFLLGYAL